MTVTLKDIHDILLIVLGYLVLWAIWSIPNKSTNKNPKDNDKTR